MTITDVANELSVNPETVRRWIRKDQLAADRIGKEYVISRPALNMFIKTRSKYAFITTMNAVPDKKLELSKEDFKYIITITANGIDKYTKDRLSDNGKAMLKNQQVMRAAKCTNEIENITYQIQECCIDGEYDHEHIVYLSRLLYVKAKELDILLEKIEIS